ncbi:unnamed protein product [Zymoseptoria tritici ST99CH_1A5]|uniref:Carboxylic ester hydrolase n=1 Tax=Zymoseptoria tritici ST99CH_1A5 TaxID=1276529 RepID=A0A1Y6L7F3_ZYMTR|nr:unnamed protein product [Zymoseptoria tritici ST99CH_1A5]
MMTFRKVCALAISLATAFAAPSVDAPTVDLGYAKYYGNSNTTLGLKTFFGIPYAEPPIGDLRWRAPEPLSHNSTVKSTEAINATTVGPQCVQGRSAWLPQTDSPGPASEDCLLINVWAPLNPVADYLPVVVNFHGGGFIAGNGSQEPGQNLVPYSNGAIVYLSVQYRLGAYGFLPGSAIRDDGALNAGLLDQRLALEWVQQNIHAFGGDPKQVTIWGGSAGGASVLYQLTWKGGESNPPFRSAIPEYLAVSSFKNETTQEAMYNTLLNAANCTSLDCLRGKTFEELRNVTQQSYLDAFDAGLYGYGDSYYQPVVDGSFIRDVPSQQLVHGNFSRVPILVDTDEFEGIGFTNFSVKTANDVKREYNRFFLNATPEFLDGLLDLYPLSDFGEAWLDSNNLFQSPVYEFGLVPLIAQYGAILEKNNTAGWANQAILGDFYIHCPARYVASAAFNQSLKVPIWKLRFNAGYFAHAAVGRYILGPTESPLIFNKTLSYIMKDWYLSFVINQDPNSPLPTRDNSSRPWFPQYGAESTVVHVNETSISYIADPDDSARCEYFQANVEITQN